MCILKQYFHRPLYTIIAEVTREKNKEKDEKHVGKLIRKDNRCLLTLDLSHLYYRSKERILQANNSRF